MPERTYSLQRAALEALLTLDDADIARVLLALEILVEQPEIPPDSATCDRRKRPLLYRQVGELIVVYRRTRDRSALIVLEILRSGQE